MRREFQPADRIPPTQSPETGEIVRLAFLRLDPMAQQRHLNSFLSVGKGNRWARWAFGFGACAALAGGEGVMAVEADRILSYNIGKFLIQPQFDASAQFTGNLLYGSENPQPGGPATINREIRGVDVPVTIQTPQGSGVESDLLWYFSPGMEVQFGVNPENSLTIGYFHDFIVYTDHSEFNAGQDRIQFDARVQKGRFTVVGNDSVAWLDTILGGTTAVAARVPVRRLAWTDTYRCTYDMTVKTDLYAVFNHDAINYLQSIQLYDQGTLRGTLGTTYKATERIGIFAEVGGGHTDVTANEPFPQQAPGDDSWVYGGFVGVRGTFTPRLTGTIKVGYETRDFTGPGVTGSTGGAAAGVALAYNPTERLLVNLTFDRRVGVSPQVAGQSYVNGLFGLSATQQLGQTGRWSLLGRLGFGFGTFSANNGLGSGVVVTPDGPVPVVFVTDQGRTDQTFTASMGVAYQPRPWLTTSLTYAFEKYSTSFDDDYVELVTGLNDFTVNRVLLQVSVGF